MFTYVLYEQWIQRVPVQSVVITMEDTDLEVN